MHYSEAALARRQEKLEAATAFPGRISAAEAVGKTVEAVTGPPEHPVLVFTDGSFLLARPHEPQGQALYDTLLSIREALEGHHPAALQALDRLAAAEAEAMRLARMEKVLGAVETNLPAIPELREALLSLLAPRESAGNEGAEASGGGSMPGWTESDEPGGSRAV